MVDTFNNWVFSWEEIENSPSRRDGISWEKEKAIRLNSCTFILEIGKYLRSGKTDNTAYIRDSAACILFHRFFMGQSFKSQNRLIVGAACLFLAGKIEGCFRHLSDIVRIYCKVRGMVRDKESPSESVMKEQQEMILTAERIILHTLCFDMHIEHHFKPMASKLHADLKMYIPHDVRVAIMNSAISFSRDSFGTVLCLLYPANLRATGALFLAILLHGIIPQIQQPHRTQGHSLSHRHECSDKDHLGKTWFDLFKNDIKEDDLKNICVLIIDVYESGNWKPKSEAKSTADIAGLKSRFSSFIDEDKNGPSTLLTKDNDANLSCQSSSNGDHITQPPPNVKKIENSVEKNRKNSPPYRMNGFSSSISLFRGSDDGTEDTSRAQAPPTKNGSVANLSTLAPPPTPDYLPPPPLPPPGASTTSASQAPAMRPPPTQEFIAPPPTPDFVPPPPMPPSASAKPTTSSIVPISRPTPEHVPPPRSPPKHQPPPHNVTDMSGLMRDEVMVASVHGKTASPLVCNKRFQGQNGFGYANGNVNTFRSDGMTSSGSSGSLSSPTNYCSPPQSEGVSTKRQRLGYSSDSGNLVR